MSAALQDLRYGLRLLFRSPAFSAIVMLALALGIGANTAIFSVVQAVLLNPVACPEPDRLLLVWEQNPSQNRYRTYVSPADFLEWRGHTRVFESLAAMRELLVSVTAPGGEPEEVPAERVTAGLFPLMGVPPLIGRTFAEAEALPGAACVAVLAERYWRRRFGGERAVLGRAIRVNSRPCTVIGVMPTQFRVYTRDVLIWLPLGLGSAETYRARGTRDLAVIGRLRPGASFPQASAEMDVLSRRLQREYAAFNSGWSADVLPLREELVGKVRPALLVLMGAVAFLLLIACSNVANLLLARAAARQREIAVRTALGAGRGRVMRQLLSESVLLALGGGFAGLLLARWVVRVLVALAPGDLPQIAHIALNAGLLAFTAGIAVLTGLLFGMAPAWVLSRPNLSAALKEGGRALTSSPVRRRLRGILVVSEVALAVVLLVGAGLMLQSLARLRQVDPGFDPRHGLTARVRLSGGAMAAPERRVEFFRRALARIRALPGVKVAGAIDNLPLAGYGSGVNFAVTGRPEPEPGDWPAALARAVDPEYFRAAGIPLRRGRPFSESDDATAPAVIAISETLARRFFPGTDPLGQRLILKWPQPITAEVVAVVGDVKANALNADPWPMIYRPHAQAPDNALTVVARTSGDPRALAGALRREIYALDPDQPVSEVRTLQQVVNAADAGERFDTVLLGAFGVLALLLAAVGIYGVMACAVAERRHEFGIRMALGAGRRGIFGLVLREGGLLALAGTVLGLTLALGLTRVLSGLLFGIKPTDTVTFAGIPILLAVAAAGASLAPALSATTVQPGAALREE